MKKQMIQSFILRDETDSQFDDLIQFDKPVRKLAVVECINFVRNNIEDYTNEDIYNALGLLGDYTLTYIGSLDIFEY